MARNRKRRGNHTPAPECTCSLKWDLNPPRHLDHEGTCALWHLEDFMNGQLDWSPVEQRLVPMYPDLEPTDDEIWSGDVPISEATLGQIIDATVAGYQPDVRVPGDWGRYVSCRHNMTAVRLPDEARTLVHCSASTDCRGRFNRPEWAVYLCNSWTPRSLALFVPWQDYGTPTISWRAARTAIEDFYAKAKSGMAVEVGCMGGHGRTGTFLACVAMLADPNLSPKGAKAWVREHYCHKAIEDSSQEYFLEWFADPSLPPVPPVKPAPVVTTVTASGGGCTAHRRGVACQKNAGHKGGHYYGGKNVAPPRAKGPVPSAGRKVPCPACAGKGNVECSTCLNWRVVDAPADSKVFCDRGFGGQCMLHPAHHGACLVAVKSGEMKLEEAK